MRDVKDIVIKAKQEWICMKKTEVCSFIVEGNIGAGKSTFLQLIKELVDAQIVYEPCDKWQRVAGTDENLLEKFYSDTPRWAYTFQTYAFVSRLLEQSKKAVDNCQGIQILERSVFSDRYCFAQNAYEAGLMSSLEWALYKEWFNWLVDQYVPRPSGFIYLKTDPEVCHKRLLKRGRHEEKVVSFDYLQSLHNRHESWLIQKNDVAHYVKNTPVLVLDCNPEFETDSVQLQKHVETIAEFIASQMMVHGIGTSYTCFEKSF